MRSGPADRSDSSYDRVVAFDLETTGLEVEEHRIVEFALIVLDRDLEELDRWHEVVNPGRPIPADATEVHGITDRDVRDAPRFDALAPVVQSVIDDAILMAYNHGFDKAFLHAELCRAGGHGVPDHAPFIDPMVHFKRLAPQTGNRLEQAVEHYLGRSLDGAHRAIHDTHAMVEVLKAQWEAHPDIASTLEDLVVEQRDWVDAGRRLYRDPDGVIRYGFGKHEGTPVLDEPGYARWMLSKDFEEGTKKVLRSLVG